MGPPARSPLWIALLAVVAIGGWTRLAQSPQVFVDGEVRPAAADAAYHLHRIQETAQTFPHAPGWDPMLMWPEGEAIPWSGGFDRLGALAVLALGARDDPARGALVAAYLPTVLGLLTLVVAALLGRSLARGLRGSESCERADAVAVATGLVFAALPNAIAVSQPGRVDHHVAEVLSMALLAAWAWRGVSRPARSTGSGAIFELCGAAIIVFAADTFAGSIVYVGVATAILLGWALRAPRRQAFLGCGALACFGTAAVMTPVALSAIESHGRTVHWAYPSLFQPALYALAGAGLAAGNLLGGFATDRVALVRASLRAVVLGAAAPFAFGLAFLLVPEIWNTIVAGTHEWMTRGDPWLATIDEFQPMFRSSVLEPGSWTHVYQFFGIFGVLAPLVLPVAVALTWRRDRSAATMLAVWTLAMVALTLLQERFGRLLCVNLAICWGIVVQSGLAALFARIPSARFEHRLTVVSAAVVLSICVADPQLRRHFELASPRPPSAIETASLFLRDAERTGGVLADWQLGHHVIWLAGRGVVASGFGTWTGQEMFDRVQSGWSRGESDLVSLMQEHELAYLVSGSPSLLGRVRTAQAALPYLESADHEHGTLNPRYFASVPLSPLVIGGSGMIDAEVRHLEHLRPVFAVPQRVPGLAQPVPLLWVYERVPGARLVGRIGRGEKVVARIRMRVGERVYPYSAWTRADETGRFELVLPLPSGASGPLSTESTYAIRVGERNSRVAVSETEVRTGETIVLKTATRPEAVRPDESDPS